MPGLFTPRTMHNKGNYIGSLGKLTRWLAEQAETLGVEVYPGFPAAEVLIDHSNRVVGVATSVAGVTVDGSHKSSFEPGMELRAKYTVLAEGSRGHLGKQIIKKLSLS